MITINLTKSKAIAHDARRIARAKEFEPYDTIIMKQIPGNDLIKAETARQAIREKYAVIQMQMDASEDVAALTALVVALQK